MNPELIEAVQSVLDSAGSLGVSAVLVGALASELAASEEPDLGIPRGTMDADFAVRLKDWDQFNALKGKLTAAGFQVDSKIEHRLHRGRSMVDLVPYGAGVAKDGELIWPVSQKAMDVIGFEEACQGSVESKVATVVLRRITIPGFVLLKTLAFQDRLATGHPKYRSDADDLLFWFRNYASGKQEDRRYDIIGQGIGEIEFLDAGAAVLGIDVAILASAEADIRVRAFLELTKDIYSPLLNAIVTPGSDEDRPRLLGLCVAFRKGYEAKRDSR